MIATVHSIVGATVAVRIKPLWLGLILAFVSHFVLDAIPHRNYSLKGIHLGWKNKKFWVVLLETFLDFIAGFIIIIIFTQNKGNLPKAVMGGLLGTIPDFMLILAYIIRGNGWKNLFKGERIENPFAENRRNVLEKISNNYIKFHLKIQPYENTPLTWGIINQIIIVLTALLLI